MLRVLIVDDEQNASGGLARLVRRWGHEVRTAGDVPAALRVAAVQRPDVVLLNFDLPGLNGCRAARRLRRDMANKACLLIAVTGWADGNRRQHCVEAGIDLLLVAPVPPAVVETLLLLECVHVNRSRTASGLERSTASDSLASSDRLLQVRPVAEVRALRGGRERQ